MAPNDPPPEYQVLDLLRRGDLRGAHQLLQGLLRQRPSDQALIARIRQVEQAMLAQAQQQVMAEPLKYAYAYLHAGRLAEALQLLRMELSRSPNNSQVRDLALYVARRIQESQAGQQPPPQPQNSQWGQVPMTGQWNALMGAPGQPQQQGQGQGQGSQWGAAGQPQTGQQGAYRPAQAQPPQPQAPNWRPPAQTQQPQQQAPQQPWPPQAGAAPQQAPGWSQGQWSQGAQPTTGQQPQWTQGAQPTTGQQPQWTQGAQPTTGQQAAYRANTAAGQWAPNAQPTTGQQARMAPRPAPPAPPPAPRAPSTTRGEPPRGPAPAPVARAPAPPPPAPNRGAPPPRSGSQWGPGGPQTGQQPAMKARPPAPPPPAPAPRAPSTTRGEPPRLPSAPQPSKRPVEAARTLIDMKPPARVVSEELDIELDDDNDWSSVETTIAESKPKPVVPTQVRQYDELDDNSVTIPPDAMPPPKPVAPKAAPPPMPVAAAPAPRPMPVQEPIPLTRPKAPVPLVPSARPAPTPMPVAHAAPPPTPAPTPMHVAPAPPPMRGAPPPMPVAPPAPPPAGVFASFVEEARLSVAKPVPARISPSDPVELLNELLQRVQERRRDKPRAQA